MYCKGKDVHVLVVWDHQERRRVHFACMTRHSLPDDNEHIGIMHSMSLNTKALPVSAVVLLRAAWIDLGQEYN